MNELGDLGLSHFIDLNAEESAYNLPYSHLIKSIEESERRLAYLYGESKNYFLELTPPENIEGFQTQLRGISENRRTALNLLLDEIMKDIGMQE